MELPGKIIEQIAFITRFIFEEHMVIVMDNSTHKVHLSQPLETNKKKFKIAVTFLTGCNGIFNVTNSNNNSFFTVSISDHDCCVISIPPGAYKLESLNDETKRILIKDGYFTGENFSFIIKPIFSTLGSIIEIKPIFIGTQFCFVHDDSIRHLLRFDPVVIYEQYTSSQKPVEILSFDNIFLEYDFAQGMTFKCKRSGIIRIYTMDVDPGY